MALSEAGALSEADILNLRRAREARRTEEFLKRYQTETELARARHNRVAEQREPSPERMKEVFNF
ncbi:hypothetical protein [Azospirillum doebereinerae]|uniref:Uncharacterized protein n=1 Tax=Azospirillum doebereinerae TaxID=92933 RepID=A0A3S0WN71_9PROT|nr:hypothetical protein [Azospirillum doebereinerae]RUQ73787.1 hypothetical protein EJ913_09020 [Azospirillum doebereinerae]